MTDTKIELLAAPLWLLFAGRDLLVGKSMELLRQIDSKGSLSKAAEAIPVSYKTAWDMIDKLNNSSVQPIVITTTGGRNGGGTKLSEYGKSLLSLYSSLERSYETVFSVFHDVKLDTDRFFNMVKGMCMKTSARNQLNGIVKRVKKGMINSEVVIDIGNGVNIVAVITNESTDNLGLTEGIEIFVLIKASAVILFPGGTSVKSSAENMLKGNVAEVRQGIVNSEVILDLPSGKTITSVVTKESAGSLGIKEGISLYAAFSSSQVILALPM